MLAAAVATAVLSPVLDNGFVNWDDDRNITENANYRGLGPPQLGWMFTTFHMGHYQPLAWASLGLDHSIWGMDPRGYHLTALLIHAASAFVFFFVARRLLGLALGAGASAGALSAAALAAALLFALHPLRVESVAWATERRDLLSGLLFLLAVLAYLRARGPGGAGGDAAAAVQSPRASLAPTLAFFLLALLSKSSALVLPAVLLVLDWYPLRRVRFRPALALPRDVLAEKVSFLALSLVFGVVALAAQAHNECLATLESRGPGGRLAIALFGLAYYARKTVLPTGLSPVHLAPGEPNLAAPAYVASAAAVVALTALFGWRAARGRPALLAAWVAYAAILAPVLGIAQVWRQIVSDRYAYLSCAGWALVAAAAPLVFARRRRAAAAWALLAAAIVALALASRREIRHWRDSESLWHHALAADPENNIAHNNLAVFLRSQGRGEEAETHLREAVRIDPSHAEAHYNLANALLESGRAEEAASHYADAIRAQAGRPAYHMNLGNALARLGRHEEAVARYREAIALEPGLAEAHWNLAVALRALGRAAEAADEERTALRLAPLPVEERLGRAAARYAAGDLEGAVVEYQEALRARPDLADARYGLGVCFLRLGRYAEAEAESRAAVAARPDDANARANLAVALASLGRPEEAVTQYETALRARPDHHAARVNLASLLASLDRFPDAARLAREGAALARARADTALAAALDEQAALYAAGRFPGK